MTETEKKDRFVCGFCQTPLGGAIDEIVLRTEEAGEVVMLSCMNCGAVLGFAPVKAGP
jgi:RNase P subunit RPR2